MKKLHCERECISAGGSRAPSRDVLLWRPCRHSLASSGGALIHLELLRQAHVVEASGRVVGEARITDRISTLAGGEGRIFVEDVNAANRKGGALQETVPEAHFRCSGSSGTTCLVVLRIAGASFRLGNKGAEIVGGLKIEQPSPFHVTSVPVGILLNKAAYQANRSDEIKAFPSPIQAGIASPSVITFLRLARIGRDAGQLFDRSAGNALDLKGI